MAELKIALGQYSDRGVKTLNQDFHGAMLVDAKVGKHKGIAVALADGISSSNVSQIASETAVTSFLADYYSTSDAWPVRQSAFCVLAATNAWLYSHTRQSPYRYDLDRGYVCTFSALIFKAASAHLLHIGDAHILRCRAGQWEQLNEDHRIEISREESYLSKALGVKPYLECDYRQVDIRGDDIFVLATDGVHEFITTAAISKLLAQCDDLDACAKAIVQQALANGSDDNLTVQLVKVLQVPEQDSCDLSVHQSQLALPPELREGLRLDGYRLIRSLHHSNRSQVWLAEDEDSGTVVALKVPSVDIHQDPLLLQRFMLESWVARRIDNPHVLKAFTPPRAQNYLYNVFAYQESRSLAQWLQDNPQPALEQVRNIAAQLVKGLQAFHRQHMLHQDLRPANILIDRLGTVTIIDFGSVRVAGLDESALQLSTQYCLGTLQYSAPEYLINAVTDERADQFSLGVIIYQLLCGQLPYGTSVGKVKNERDFKWLEYQTLTQQRPDIPTWLDASIRKAVHPDANKRYPALSEFMTALNRPDAEFQQGLHKPLAQRNPLLFWQSTAALFALLALILLWQLLQLN